MLLYNTWSWSADDFIHDEPSQRDAGTLVPEEPDQHAVI